MHQRLRRRLRRDDATCRSRCARSSPPTAEIRGPPVVSDTTAADGTRKWLLDVGAGNAIETVYIPEDDRGTLCISSQAGCALDCAFCSTGKQGFNRNLTTAEIVGQLWHANRALSRTLLPPKRASPLPPARGARGMAPGAGRQGALITNVVMMGMGEPLANFDNVVAALRVFLDDNAYGLSRRRVTLSTSGIVPAIDRLRERVPRGARRVAARARRRAARPSSCRSTASTRSPSCSPRAGATSSARRAIS